MNRLSKANLLSLLAGTALCGAVLVQGAMAQETDAAPLAAGTPLGAVSESGEATVMSPNVKVFGSFHFTESCTFDPERNLILSMNLGNFETEEGRPRDGFVSLINPDGSVHTAKWIGRGLGGVTLNNPIGSAIAGGTLYTVDGTSVLSFDLKTGEALNSFPVEGATFLNGIAVGADGTAYASNSRQPHKIYKVTSHGKASVFAEGDELKAPNGVAMDREGNVVVVNMGNNAVLTYDTKGKLLRTEHAVESGNDGVVVTEDGTKYTSSVEFGSVSRIRPGEEGEIIASGIPSAASMCYDSTQNQLVIPLNPNNALAFISLE